MMEMVTGLREDEQALRATFLRDYSHNACKTDQGSYLLNRVIGAMACEL